MIGSNPLHHPQTRVATALGWWRFILIATAATLLGWVAFAHAASLRICILDNSAGMSTAPVFVNGNPFNPDMLEGSTVASGKRCNVLPIPAAIVRGVDQSTTVKYVNALGEVSAPSNALPFRLQPSPPVPVLDSVQAVFP